MAIVKILDKEKKEIELIVTDDTLYSVDAMQNLTKSINILISKMMVGK